MGNLGLGYHLPWVLRIPIPIRDPIAQPRSCPKGESWNLPYDLPCLFVSVIGKHQGDWIPTPPKFNIAPEKFPSQ